MSVRTPKAPPRRSALVVFVRQRFKLLVAFFPALVIGAELYLVYRALHEPSALWLALVCLHPYLTPLLCFRAHNLVFPLREGGSYFGIDYYSPWLTAHRLQIIYAVFPVLERVLTVVPGLFSLWLRAWGSRVGRGVLWLPGVEITDRSHLDIGDNVFIGNKVYLSPHIVRDAGDKRFLLFYRRITIGSGSFIGAGSRFGPGAMVPAGSRVPILSDLYLNQRFQAATDKEPQ